MTRKPFHKVERNTELLGLVHFYICELNDLITKRGKMYFITFIGDFSRYTYVNLMKTKDEALNKFEIDKTEVENQLKTKIKILKSDRGGEYTSNEFVNYCEKQCIIHQITTPYTLQQNEIAEKKIEH